MNNKQYELIGESIWNTYYEIGLLLEAKEPKERGTFFAHKGVRELEKLGAAIRAGKGKGKEHHKALGSAMRTLRRGGEEMEAAKKPVKTTPRTQQVRGGIQGPWPPRRSNVNRNPPRGRPLHDPDTGEDIEDIPYTRRRER